MDAASGSNALVSRRLRAARDRIRPLVGVYVWSALVLAGLLLIGGTGCSMIHDDTSPGGESRVTVTVSTDTLVITNRTDVPIWTFVAGQQALITMLWAPRIDGDGIAPGESEQVAIADIPKGADEQEVIVYWWPAVTENGERVPGDPRSITVAL